VLRVGTSIRLSMLAGLRFGWTGPEGAGRLGLTGRAFGEQVKEPGLFLAIWP